MNTCEVCGKGFEGKRRETICRECFNEAMEESALTEHQAFICIAKICEQLDGIIDQIEEINSNLRRLL